MKLSKNRSRCQQQNRQNQARNLDFEDNAYGIRKDGGKCPEVMRGAQSCFLWRGLVVQVAASDAVSFCLPRVMTVNSEWSTSGKLFRYMRYQRRIILYRMFLRRRVSMENFSRASASRRQVESIFLRVVDEHQVHSIVVRLVRVFQSSIDL